MLKHSFTLPSILIGTVATIAIVQTVAVRLSPTEINQVAKQFVVRINGSEWMLKGNGSGSIIGKDGNTYQVLTNRHVVSESENINDYTIQTVDNQTHRVLKIEPLKGADLAIITFSSRNQYRVAKLGNSEKLTEGQAIHFAGYPADTFRSYRFYSNESINGFLPVANAEDGYEIIFTGAFVPGMSGSPLLDNEGEIIGIYGRGELGGILYGIRINTAIELAQQQNVYLIALGNIPTPQPSPSSSPIPTTAIITPPSPSPRETPSNITPLISRATNVNYTPLRELLQAGKWKEADQLTWELMLAAAKREDEGWLNVNSLENFACEDLAIMDQEWSNASNGKFGFGVQKKLWQEVGSPEYDAPIETWRRLYIRLGWKTGTENESSGYVAYNNITFNPQNAPEGHLPRWWVGLWESEVGWGMGWRRGILFSRCDL